jgi:hypothetical protein
MALVCPRCRDDTLVISASLELPGDCRSDEITVQVVDCAACGFEGLAVYEESRRGGFDSESVDHRAHAAAPEVVGSLRRQLAGCRQHANPRCRCAAHVALGEKNANGRWIGLQRYDLGPRMPIGFRKG